VAYTSLIAANGAIEQGDLIFSGGLSFRETQALSLTKGERKIEHHLPHRE
jgi:hypothetical protein